MNKRYRITVDVDVPTEEEGTAYDHAMQALMDMLAGLGEDSHSLADVVNSSIQRIDYE